MRTKTPTRTTLLVILLVSIVYLSPAIAQQTDKTKFPVIWGDDIGWSNIRAYNTSMMGYRTTPDPFDAVSLSPKLNDAASTSTAPFEPIENKGLRWLPAISQSLFFTGIQHAVRFTEPETRRRFSGPFFPDWFESAKSLFGAGWDDGGHDFTNYLAHPAAGSVWGFIYRHNHRSEQMLEIDWNRSYVSHLGKSMLWSFVWSLQFELGPFSESSLGNVYESCPWCARSVAWVDIVVTPLVGVGVLSVAEDALDRWVIKKLELKTNKVGRGVLRVVLNPTRAFAMLMGFKKPWHRDNR